MSYSKKFLISQYKAVKLCLRRQPSAVEFRNKTGVSFHKLQGTFGRNCWSKLVIASGDKPKIFSPARWTSEQLLENWGSFARKINKIPRQPDWCYYKFKPSVVTYRCRFGSLPGIAEEFKKFARNKTGWDDVTALMENEEPPHLTGGALPDKYSDSDVHPLSVSAESPVRDSAFLTPASESSRCFNRDRSVRDSDETENMEYKKYIPHILTGFEDASKTNPAEFENGAALVYQLLGFQVLKLGKVKTGKREPDGIAFNKGSYAIIYDSKSRKDSYCIRTDDRRIIEYIKKYRDKIKREGCGKIYFQIISGKFKGNPAKALSNIKKETQVQLTLIKADDLLRILSKKIERPLGFSLNNFESLLLENGVIKTRKIDNFLTEIE